MRGVPAALGLLLCEARELREGPQGPCAPGAGTLRSGSAPRREGVHPELLLPACAQGGGPILALTLIYLL